MINYLIPKDGVFFKAALHCHSTVSDGKLTPSEIKSEYQKLGFSIVAYTDHELMIPHPELLDESFLPITAYEIAIDKKKNWPKYQNTYHLNIYSPELNRSVSGTFCEAYVHKKEHMQNMITDEMRAAGTEGREYSKEFVQKIIDIATDEGCLVSYNHPVWSMNTRDDYSGLKGLFGVEWMNTGCDMAGYVDSMQPITELLAEGERMCYPLASDDCHSRAEIGKSWVQVKAKSLDYDEIFSALKRGDFYSSNGPEIKELYVKEGIVYIKTSNVKRITLITDHRFVMNAKGKDGYVTEASFSLDNVKEHIQYKPEGHKSWIRFDVVDEFGKYARTRAYFPEEFLK